ncbi:hypothetical protein EDEG_03880 [Edhazardia aedis USNM 41457]|uniref:Uncharacterized protein n=1 Tax=Edhazardia aedis (strain USNM 41457) TaxID=1003232 RepID=J8ZPF4_EDHAE|nr:hypothetical protein EDEG_03880 [Edhazardia aedis USNM 41457]|eukprot:EJW01553.1 hypothetical protein EDEG_03880 [Edhazardia aedis USNM 41457]
MIIITTVKQQESSESSDYPSYSSQVQSSNESRHPDFRNLRRRNPNSAISIINENSSSHDISSSQTYHYNNIESTIIPLLSHDDDIIEEYSNQSQDFAPLFSILQKPYTANIVFFSISIPFLSTCCRRNNIIKNLRKMSNFYYENRWYIGKQYIVDENKIDSDILPIETAEIKNNDDFSSDKISFEALNCPISNGLPQFLKQWIDDYNKSASLSQKIDYYFDNINFDDFLRKLIADKFLYHVEGSKKGKSTFKFLDYDDILDKVLYANYLLISYISEKLCSQDIKKACIKIFLYGFDFDEKGAFYPGGRIFDDVYKHFFLSALGKNILRKELNFTDTYPKQQSKNIFVDKNICEQKLNKCFMNFEEQTERLNNLKVLLDKFSSLYTDNFVLTNTGFVLTAKKAC